MKIFEKCIRQELSNACDELIDPRQHGFMNAKSCTTQMVPFTYDLALTPEAASSYWRGNILNITS